MQCVAEIADARRQCEAQVPDQKVAWAATDEATNAAAVTFTNLGGGQTSLHLWLALYARLHARSPTRPVVLNRAVALTFRGGRLAGLAELEIVATAPELAGSSLVNRPQPCSDRPGVLVRPSVRPAPRRPRRWARMPAC